MLLALLYLLGGASRSGKSILARRLLDELRVPHLALDLLMMGFARGLPEHGVGPSLPAPEVAERLWPVVRGMAQTAAEDELDYLFEGDALLPGQAAELGRSLGEGVRVAFLGYVDAPPARKLREVHAFGGNPNDWVANLTDDRIPEITARNAEFSARLRGECAALGLPYFDTSRDFPGALDDAFRHLAAQ